MMSCTPIQKHSRTQFQLCHMMLFHDMQVRALIPYVWSPAFHFHPRSIGKAMIGSCELRCVLAASHLRDVDGHGAGHGEPLTNAAMAMAEHRK